MLGYTRHFYFSRYRVIRAVPAGPRLARTPENLDIMYPPKEWLTIPILVSKSFTDSGLDRVFPIAPGPAAALFLSFLGGDEALLLTCP